MSELRKLFERAGFSLDESREEAFTRYLKHLQKWNRVHNLTAVKGEEEIVRRHFIDSLTLSEAFSALGVDWKDKSLADVGSGAGFPGVPLKIYLRDFHLYLIESSSKRCSFLESLKIELGLGYRVLCERAEEVDTKFHIVVARALGEFEKIAPILEALSEAWIFVMKGRRIKERWTREMGYGLYKPSGSEGFVLYKRV